MMKFKIFSLATAALSLCLSNWAFAQQEDPALFMSRANVKIAKATAFPNTWEGPKSGKAISATKKLVVFIGSDQKNSTVVSLFNNVNAAATVAGWDVFPIYCWGMKKQHAEAFSRAIALKPAAIILAGIDAADQPKEMKAAAAKKIPVVGWHAALTPGPQDGLFTNVTSDPKEAAQVAALLSVVESNGKAGVVVVADPSNQYSMTKANEIASVIKQCATCSLLSVEEVPTGITAVKMKGVLDSLVKRHGKKWTHVVAANDMYLDAMSAPANASILSENKVQTIAAGDGSVAAYQRIKVSSQIGTVPEPLGLHGWQLIDEIHRATSAQKPSGYTTPVYLITKQNLPFHGGKFNSFEPDNGYRAMYQKIWQK